MDINITPTLFSGLSLKINKDDLNATAKVFDRLYKNIADLLVKDCESLDTEECLNSMSSILEIYYDVFTNTTQIEALDCLCFMAAVFESNHKYRGDYNKTCYLIRKKITGTRAHK